MNQEENSEKNQQESKNSFLGAGLALLLATAAFFSGLHIGFDQTSGARVEAGLFSLFAKAPQASDEVDMAEFWRVWDLLEKKYVISTTSDEVTIEDRMQGAISGLVKSYGDPYTVYLPPADATMLEEDISGNFSGVGMEVGMRDGLITVISPLPDTPAYHAGVIAQDTVVKIDDVSTEGMNVDEAVGLIRGEKGTEVVLTVYREGESEFLVIPIIRDSIDIPTVKTKVDGDIFILTLHSFNALAEMKVQEALREYIQSGKEKLIIDLRGNPGGYLQSAISIGSFFVPVGEPIVRERFGDERQEEVYRSSGKTLKQYAPKEMVVLVDGGSASAAEILAGALQEHDLATLIGAQTFGKGSVQELIDLSNGSSLKVTIARWFTPNGVSISEGGLTPDIKIDRTPQQRIADIDYQLDGALRYLRGEEVTSSTTDMVAE